MKPPTLPRALAKAMADDRALTRVLFERPESLSAILPYSEFTSDGLVWHLADGSLGTVFTATLLEHEPMTGDQIIQAVRDLSPWLSLPENCTLQVVFEQYQLAAKDQVFKALAGGFPDPHPVAKMLFERRLADLRSACERQDERAPLARRLLLAIRYFPGGDRQRPHSRVLRSDERLLLGETKDFIQHLKAFRAICSDFAAGSKVPLRALDDAELLTVLRQFFNPKSYYERPFLPLSRNSPFSEQVIYHSPRLDHTGIEREGIKTRTISLKTSPQLVYPGGMAYFTRLPFPFRLALSFSFPTPGKVRKFFDMKEFFLENTPSARSRRQRQEILTVQDQLAMGNRCVHMTFSVTVEGGSDGELERRTRDVLGVLQNDLGCDGIVEDMIGLGLCLNTLPLMYTPKADHSSRRFIRILRSDATKLLPIFDSFRGLATPQQLYLSRERNLVPFSLTGNETSNHTVVLADTGSGKSAFIIDCIQAAKRQSLEPLVFVIDKKSSYLTMSEYFDADLTVFQRGRPVPFSPFRGVFDEEKVAFMTNLIAAGVKLTSKSFNIESEHLTAVAQALRLAHAAKTRQAGLAYVGGELRRGEEPGRESYLSMDDLVAELAALPATTGFERFDAAIQALIGKLSPFYGDGVYAPFFRGSGDTAPGKSKLFFIYDLDALDSDPTLQALMTMAVVEEIRQTIKLPENKGRSGFIVLEELGMLGRDNPQASQFIRDAAETFRKLGYWLIGLTPRPQNYFETEAGKAMWGAADNFIFLQMSEDNARYLAEHSSLLDEASLGIVKSLATVRGQYADVFYMNKKKTHQGAFRFVQTPLDRWLAPTNAKDAALVLKAMKRAGGDKWRALAELAASPVE